MWQLMLRGLLKMRAEAVAVGGRQSYSGWCGVTTGALNVVGRSTRLVATSFVVPDPNFQRISKPVKDCTLPPPEFLKKMLGTSVIPA